MKSRDNGGPKQCQSLYIAWQEKHGACSLNICLFLWLILDIMLPYVHKISHLCTKHTNTLSTEDQHHRNHN